MLVICAAREICGVESCEHSKPHEHREWKGCNTKKCLKLDNVAKADMPEEIAAILPECVEVK